MNINRLAAMGGKTNPEELFAAGYAARFHGAVNCVAADKNIATRKSTVEAHVEAGPDDHGPGAAPCLTVPPALEVLSKDGGSRMSHMYRRLGLVLCAWFGLASHAGMAQSAGTFTAAGSMTTPRVSHTATLLTNGKVLITGGYQLNPVPWLALASAEIYDPSTQAFAATGNMTRPRYNHVATLLPDGKVLIAGGLSPGATDAELYDPSTGTFTATGDMTMARQRFSATLLNNGKVLIAGGYANEGGNFSYYLATAELYDPSTGTFTATGGMTAVRASHTASLLPDGNVLIAGGDVADGPIASAEIYDSLAGTFRVTGGTAAFSGPVGRAVGAAALLMNGSVLGTLSEYETPAGNAAVVYDPGTGAFAATGNLTSVRAATLTLLPDGTVLDAGFGLVRNFHYDGRPSADLYDPAAGKFSAAPEMAAPRFGHTATLLPDGSVLIAGGAGSIGAAATLDSAEFYRPAVLVPAAVLFSLSGDGQGQGAIWNATGQVASAGNPAIAGEALAMYTTSLVDGAVIPPQVTVGGRLAEVVFFGSAPGYPGYNQVNFRVPGGVAPGTAVPVRLTYLGRPSNEVTIAVQ